mgnify:CR=1 FL=1
MILYIKIDRRYIMYTWGYIKDCALAKLDLNKYEVYDEQVNTVVSRFPFYANEAMTQICSAIKPNYKFADFVITADKVGVAQTMPDDFICFGEDRSTMDITDHCGRTFLNVETHDDDYTVRGYNQVVFFHEATYHIAYNARWFTFTDTVDDDTVITAPNDVLDCIPSYIAHQCYKIDDDVKAQIFRDEYEMTLARINNNVAFEPKTIKIGGGWD